MLIQSHEGFIKLLPALPTEWPTGKFYGVKARGGFEVDFEWENKKLTRVRILSTAGKICRIQLPDGLKEFETEIGKSYVVLK
jgi:alpha-L-fucosidase 2